MIHLIDRFTDKLKTGRYNNITIKAYRDAVFTYYNRFRDQPQLHVDEDRVATYLNELKTKKGYSNEQIIQNGKAIKLFYKLIYDKNLDIKATGERKSKPPYILSTTEISRLFDYVKHPKHSIIIRLSYGLGLKLNEIITLKKENIDLKNNVITVGDEKDSSIRTLRIPKQIRSLIENYMQKKGNNSVYLFANPSGGTISPRGIQLYFSRVIEDLGLDKSITLQNLRHSYAVHLLNRGIDVHHLQRALGHKFLQTTSIYIPLSEFKLEEMESPMD